MLCTWCEEELQKGDEIYDFQDGTLLCRGCLREWAEQYREIYGGLEEIERF